MLINKIKSIKEFREIKELKGPKLSKFDILIGQNNSGKTAIDGRWEQIILKSIAERSNGKDKIIYFPKSSFKSFKKIGLNSLFVSSY